MPAKPLLANSPAFQQWMRDVAAMPAEQQVEAVSKKLVELNPGFDGKVMNFDMSGPPWIEIGVVKQLGFISDNVTDISPLRALVGLTHFNCGGGLGKTKLANLSPLKDMKLSVLVFSNTQVSDLSPLEGMPLTFLNCDFTLVSDFSPLKDIKLTTLTAEGSKVFDLSPLGEMPLTILNCGYTRVSDLSPLKNMKLAHLCCWHTTVSDLSPLNGMPIGTLQLNATRVTDLSPLRGMKLTSLHVDNTAVSDLSPLKGMPLTEMHCGSTQVTDLSPLHGMRLKVLNCDFNPERDTDLLRSIKTLETIKKKPAAEFWKEVEEQQKGKKIGFQMPGFDQWIKDVAAMPAEQQVEAVSKKLVELNPGFDGKVTGLNPNSPPKIENGVVTELQFFTDNVSDISPVRALTGLKSLECRGSKFRLGQLTDLSPLKGLPLSSLNFAGTNVSDLTPVKDLSSLRELIFYDTPTADL